MFLRSLLKTWLEDSHSLSFEAVRRRGMDKIVANKEGEFRLGKDISGQGPPLCPRVPTQTSLRNFLCSFPEQPEELVCETGAVT